MSDTTRDLDLCFLSIGTLGAKYRGKELSPVEVTDAMLRRIDRHNDTMHAYITVTHDVATEQAKQAERDFMAGLDRGPLQGVTVALKDNITTKDIRTSCASMVDPDWIPDYDATVYARLRDAGAILAGKLNLYEYAFSMNPHYPSAVNPWNPAKTSAGSSSGTGVSVAAGMVHGAIGSDTGGSGRAPANVNGAVGLKATFGRVSCWGVVPLSYSLDHATMMARTVRDAGLMLRVTAGRDERDENSSFAPVTNFTAKLDQGIRGMKIGYARGHTLEGLDPEVESVIREAAAVIRDLGATVEDVELPFVREAGALQSAIMLPEAATYHRERHRTAAHNLGESALMRLDLGAFVPATAYVQAQMVRKAMRDAYRDLLDRFDVIIGPALGMRPGDAGGWTTRIDGKEIDMRDAGPEYTGIYNLTGMPAMVLPAGFSSEQTPIGLQIAGRWFDEATVLQVGHAFEQATDWHTRRPPHPGA